MKTIGAILLVLVAVMGMAMPVLGAEAGSSAGAYADWGIAQQYTFAWGQDDEYTAYPDAYADAGTSGIAEGTTESSSSAAASDNDWAGAETGGYAQTNQGGDIAASGSDLNAESWDDDGTTETSAGSYAIGSYVESYGGASAYWGDLVTDPIYSNSWANAYSSDDYAESGGWSYAEIP